VTVGGRCRDWGLAIAAAVAALATAASPAGAFTPEQEALMTSEVEATMQQAGYPGMLVGVWTEGQGSFIATPGLADTATGRQMAFRDQARVGSITKTFTGTVILQLAEEDLIGLGDPIKKYIPKVTRGRQITIRMLLNHTSGFVSLPPGVANASVATPHRNWRLNQIIFRGLRQLHLSPPGTEWHYSNLNYLLLAAIAEQVTGEPMRRLYRERVIEPLGLKQTTFRPSGRLPVGAVHGYFLESPTGSFLDTFDWNFSWAYSAGAMVSSLRDLHRYGPALVTGEGLLGRKMQRQRLTFVDTGGSIGPGQELLYGLGIWELPLGTTEPIPYLGHDGIVYGYDAIVLHSPQAQTTIAMVGNTAVELDAFPNDALRPTLIDLADVLAAIAQGQPVPQ
jgi:D-alanyl-D-alanine carboxypeptidase